MITTAGWALAIATHGNGGAGGGLILAGWIGAIATSFAIRPAHERLVDSGFQSALLTAEDRLADRARGRQLAMKNPALALELGVGRPDRAGGHAAGLVDVNNAPPAVLAHLPGVDEHLARRIAAARAELRGFSSVEDLGETMELDADLVEKLRDLVVFVPR